jgi:hypothetical protein
VGVGGRAHQEREPLSAALVGGWSWRIFGPVWGSAGRGGAVGVQEGLGLGAGVSVRPPKARAPVWSGSAAARTRTCARSRPRRPGPRRPGPRRPGSRRPGSRRGPRGGPGAGPAGAAVWGPDRPRPADHPGHLWCCCGGGAGRGCPRRGPAATPPARRRAARPGRRRARGPGTPRSSTPLRARPDRGSGPRGSPDVRAGQGGRTTIGHEAGGPDHERDGGSAGSGRAVTDAGEQRRRRP